MNSNFICSYCGGIMLGDMPREWRKTKLYHPHCATKQDRKDHLDKDKKLAEKKEKDGK